SGNRVQAWLDHPAAVITLTWRARGSTDSTRVAVPVIGHVGATSASLVRRVCPLNGWAIVDVSQIVGRERVTSQAPGEIAWRSSSDQPTIFKLLPPLSNIALHVHSAIGLQGDRIRMTRTVNFSGLPADR